LAVNPWGSLLGVWAHPDDEGYLSAGHMMRAVAAGDRVRCVTATRGELGSTDEVRWPPGSELARVRTAELEAALATLGVTEHVWLDHADGSCADVPDEVGAAEILAQLVDFRPDTVLTFGPDGITGHPDHIAVSRWVDAAVAACDDPPQVLWSTQTTEWIERWRKPLDALGVFLGNEPLAIARHEVRSDPDLTDEEAGRKLASLLCQTSQVAPLVQAFGLDAYREAMTEEVFR
jgi:LmbE family N-acetylglucosaminyl deacetylase